MTAAILADADSLPSMTEPFVMLLPQPLGDAELGALADANPSLIFEQSSEGYLIVSPPSPTFSNYGEVELLNQVFNWNKRVDFGMVGGLTGGPELPKGGRYAPDAYVSAQRDIDQVTAAERKLWFAPLPVIAVFELLSPSNKTRKGKERLRLLLADCERNAVPLVVLLDKKTRSTTMIRPGREDVMTTASTVTFDELPGLELNVTAIFAAGE